MKVKVLSGWMRMLTGVGVPAVMWAVLTVVVEGISRFFVE